MLYSLRFAVVLLITTRKRVNKITRFSIKQVALITEKPMRRGGLLYLILTNNDKLVGNMKLKDSLSCSDHETVARDNWLVFKEHLLQTQRH